MEVNTLNYFLKYLNPTQKPGKLDLEAFINSPSYKFTENSLAYIIFLLKMIYRSNLSSDSIALSLLISKFLRGSILIHIRILIYWGSTMCQI